MSTEPAEKAAEVEAPNSALVRAASKTNAEMAKQAAMRKAGKVSEEDEKKGAKLDMIEHTLTIPECEKHCQTSVKEGLSEEDAAERLLRDGFNELSPPPSVPMWRKFLDHQTGFFSLLLWGAAVLCFIAYGLDSEAVDNLYLGIVLAIVVFFTGCFSFYQDFQADAIMQGFKKLIPAITIVTRDGKTKSEFPARDLVVGDIVTIENGKKIPADVRMFDTSGFKVNNSSMTGEPLPLERTPKVDPKDKRPLESTNTAFFGTLCCAGNGRGIVIATGDRTVIGKIANLAATAEEEETPIAQEIEHFIKIISSVAIFLGVVFLIIGIFKGFNAIDNVVFCIGIIVANVPEGLLATVTVSLSLTALRMKAKKVLVKNLEAVETLGSTSVIASDKTGTLTQNRMTVENIYCDTKKINSLEVDLKSPTFTMLHNAGVCCSTATFDQKETNLALPIKERIMNGDAGEQAFMKYFEAMEPISVRRTKHPRVAGGLIPFNSANKYMMSIHAEDGDYSKDRLLFFKGAPERVWDRCTTMLVEGKAVEKKQFTKNYQDNIFKMMNGGERVLGLAMKRLPADKYPEGFKYDTKEYNFPTEELTFLGLISLIDPPRLAVPGSVLLCQKAGIQVIMVTGDHAVTAEAIARQVNIIKKESKTIRDLRAEKTLKGENPDDIDDNDPRISAVVIEGKNLETYTEEDLDKVLNYDDIVFARTSPQQKLFIVKGLQKKTLKRNSDGTTKAVNHVVAVTGDGVNDSPALRKANIGVAMGIAGSDVAKDAADMILLNDNFASIVDGVEEGRLIFDNLKKSIAYTLSSNIPEITPFLLFILVALPLPLTTVLILCIDLGTDMVPAISLAYENKEANIMEKKPRDMNVDRLVTAKLISFAYLQIGIIQALAGFYTYFVVLNDYGFQPSILPGLSEAFTADLDGDDDRPQIYHEGDSCGKAKWYYDGKSLDLNACNICNANCHNPKEALAHAQCAYFISIIIVQWADIMACKTRTLSIYHQGMRNNMLNFGLVFETVLGAFFCYVPGLSTGLGTRAIEIQHWFPAMPFAIVILGYDEIRKYVMRLQGEEGWVYINTYY